MNIENLREFIDNMKDFPKDIRVVPGYYDKPSFDDSIVGILGMIYLLFSRIPKLKIAFDNYKRKLESEGIKNMGVAEYYACSRRRKDKLEYSDCEIREAFSIFLGFEDGKDFKNTIENNPELWGLKTRGDLFDFDNNWKKGDEFFDINIVIERFEFFYNSVKKAGRYTKIRQVSYEVKDTIMI